MMHRSAGAEGREGQLDYRRGMYKEDLAACRSCLLNYCGSHLPTSNYILNYCSCVARRSHEGDDILGLIWLLGLVWPDLN